MAAQQLHLMSGGFNNEGHLFHWRREGGRAGEIDYLLELDGRILPVEVKMGAAGSMKSLHQFMHDKRLPLAIRLDRNPPSLQSLEVSTTQGQPVRYQLLNLPHYLCGFAWRIAGDLFDEPRRRYRAGHRNAPSKTANSSSIIAGSERV